MNLHYYGFAMNDKDLRNYLDNLISNSDEDDEYNYTESDNPPE